MNKQEDIAIVGMSGIFPGAGDVKSFWDNIREKKDAIRPVPEHRIASRYFREGGTDADQFYCSMGGFIDAYAHFDPIPFGILPLAVEGMEPEQLLSLRLAHAALTDAGLQEDKILLEKTAIIIGKGNYTGPGAVRAIDITRTGEQIVQILAELLPGLSKKELQTVKKEFQQKQGRFSADTAMGLIPNLAASLAANRLNLGGAAYTVDAACASSLIAVDQAVQELQNMRADVVLAGGVHASQNAPFWSIFTQLGALSRNQQIRPFDRKADGLLIGEGCGFVVLRRLSDALESGQRIYALIKGAGVASDGGGLSVMSPSMKGQQRAIEQAWQNAGIPLEDIGYIEAHGTGTPLGDQTEIDTLRSIFSKPAGQPKAGLGTVKSMIGHAMPAAGIAGLIKTSLALYYKKLPPTLHCDDPLPQLQDSCFTPVRECRDWQDTGLPLVAGINAFGFGGINAHVVLQAYEQQRQAPSKSRESEETPALSKPLMLARDTPKALIAALEHKAEETGDGEYRIAVFNPTSERIKKAIRIVQRHKPWHNKQDIWFTGSPMLRQGGKLAFLFPGLDALADGEVESVARHFNLPFRHKNAGSEQQDAVLSKAMQLLEKSDILDKALKSLGIRPDMNAGHSLGEWQAGRASGIVSDAAVASLLQRIQTETFDQQHTRFLAVGTGYESLQPLIRNIEDLHLAIDNCPQQVILCGSRAAVDALTEILRKEQIFHTIMPFSSGFHSPFAKDKVRDLEQVLRQMTFGKAAIPLWSATTLESYPEAFDQIIKLHSTHLTSPVRFRELMLKLYASEQVRCFIQVGSGGLAGFVQDTLKGKEHLIIAASSPLRTGMEQLQRVLAALFVEGKAVDLSLFGPAATASKTNAGTHKPIPLQLGSPFVKDLDTIKGLSIPGRATPAFPAGEQQEGTLMKTFLNNYREMVQVQEEILDVASRSKPGKAKGGSVSGPPDSMQSVSRQTLPAETTFSKGLDISVENSPYLKDHALIKQKPGWSCIEDTDPVIPMTMVIELLADMAKTVLPDRQVKTIKQVQVHKWLNVSRPFRESIQAKNIGKNVLQMQLGDYGSALVEVTPSIPEQESISLGTGVPLPLTVTPEQIYQNHMFHGPLYQGIVEVMEIGDKGIRGIIKDSGGKGALLDNAGQLFGLWLQLTLKIDRIAFPVRIEEVSFFGDYTDQSGTFICTCQLSKLTDEFAWAEILLERQGKPWAVIRGWQNRRLEIDTPLWNVSMDPLNHFLGEELAPGVRFFNQAYKRVVSWDFILKRYFNQQEKAAIRALPPNKQKERIISRVAAKDAVRTVLKQSGKSCYPIEFEILANAAGKPELYGAGLETISLSIAHKKHEAVAIAVPGRPVGIDMEEIKDREEAFADIAFTEGEKNLLKDKAGPEWMTRFWVAKEAYGKLLGTGLKGNPKAFVVSKIEDENLQIENTIIHTLKYKNYIIGWTI